LQPLHTDEIIGRNQQAVIRKDIAFLAQCRSATLPCNDVHRSDQASSDVLLVRSAGKE
jgi:hypothetical protein